MSAIRRFLATAFVVIASVSMGAETPLNVYACTTFTESSAVERVALEGLEAATLVIAGLAQLDEAVFGIAYVITTS